MSADQSKTCTRCGGTKPLDEFPRNGRGGHRADCKICHAAQVRAIYHANPDASRTANAARQRRYYQQDPDKLRKRAQAFKTANPEKHLAWSLRWAARNPEKVREYKRKWDAANPEKKRDAVRARRARRQAAFVADVRFDEILQRDLGLCGICGQQIADTAIELDHVIPLAAGGTHEPDNVQLAHPTCNRKKSAKVDFLLRQAA